jgi:putative DNA primase/helicase
VGWAGELATHWGITGWQQGQAIGAAASCFNTWLRARGGDGNFEEKQMLEHVRQQFTKYSESRFKRWDDPEESKNAVIDSHVPIAAECWGYRREPRTKDYLEGDSSDVIFYVYKDAFKNDICKGYDHNRIAKMLRTLGALQPTVEGNGKERMDRKEKLPRMGNKRVWCYKITLSALMVEGEESENDLQSVAGF